MVASPPPNRAAITSSTAMIRKMQRCDEHGARTFPRSCLDPSPAGAPASRRSSSAIAPGLSSGLFWLPHFGDWTHDGQPVGARAGRDRLARGAQPAGRRRGSRARRSRHRPGGRRGRRRSAGRCRGAGRWRPRRCPSGRRSRTAAAGRSRRARPRGRRRAGRPAASAGLGEHVVGQGPPHGGGLQLPARAGRAAPRRSPRREGTFRFRKDTTWWETRTSPRLSRASPQGTASRSPRISMSVISRAEVE